MFQQDNASSHTARAVQAFLNQEHIQTLPWQAFSPSMSLTEHLMNALSRHI
uniref:Tc1-like transposase DDE domain-containing protein n=1 Tax=Oreochromis niloticus TaxID=8128 RepID=A0A669BBJ1_ORENI